MNKEQEGIKPTSKEILEEINLTEYCKGYEKAIQEKNAEFKESINEFIRREKSWSCSCKTVPKGHICHFCFNIEELKKRLKL